jgi:hypothetical protein
MVIVWVQAVSSSKFTSLSADDCRERFEYDLELEFGTVGAFAHGRNGSVDLQQNEVGCNPSSFS